MPTFSRSRSIPASGPVSRRASTQRPFQWASTSWRAGVACNHRNACRRTGEPVKSASSMVAGSGPSPPAHASSCNSTAVTSSLFALGDLASIARLDARRLAFHPGQHRSLLDQDLAERPAEIGPEEAQLITARQPDAERGEVQTGQVLVTPAQRYTGAHL